MLAFERKGAGLPIVFLHAFPLSHRMWDGNVPVFSKNFQFITPDLPGFGESHFTDDTASMEFMAGEVLSLLDHLNLQQKCVIAGLSMGGYVMLQMLRLAPERFRAAAFLSTRSGADGEETRSKRFANIELIQKEGLGPFADRSVQTLLGKSTLSSQPNIRGTIKSLIQTADPKSVCAALRGMAARGDTTTVLDSLEVPSLFISGEEDLIIPSSEMESLSKKVKKSEFHVLPKAGHLFNLEQPDSFHDLFLHFLKRRVL